MTCLMCYKPIEGNGILISVDGDFVCDAHCRKAWEQQKDRLTQMTDVQFETWLTQPKETDGHRR